MAILARAAIFPLQPNQMPVLSLSAALMATSSPPGRTFAIFSGMATLFETTTSCPNSGPLHDADWPSLNNPPVMLVGSNPFITLAITLKEPRFRKGQVGFLLLVHPA